MWGLPVSLVAIFFLSRFLIINIRRDMALQNGPIDGVAKIKNISTQDVSGDVSDLLDLLSKCEIKGQLINWREFRVPLDECFFVLRKKYGETKEIDRYKRILEERVDNGDISWPLSDRVRMCHFFIVFRSCFSFSPSG